MPLRIRPAAPLTLLVTLGAMLFARDSPAQSGAVSALGGTWIYVEDRTEGRALEQLGPPMSSTFAMRVEQGAVILVSGHGSGHTNVRIALDGSITTITEPTQVVRYRGAWKDGAFSYQVDFVRGTSTTPDRTIRREFQSTPEGLVVRAVSAPTGPYESFALYRHAEEIAMPTPAKATIGGIGWLAGAWTGTRSSGSTIEERWSPPLGGAMLGVSRTVSRGRMSAFEYLRIVERDSGLVYIAQPNGAAPTDFVLTELTSTRAVFANPRHDYPKRIVYELSADGALTATIGFMKGGTPRRFDYIRADSLTAGPSRRAAAAPPRKAVFIILDGIPADVIERVATPAIDAIAAAGGYARAHVGGELGGPTETPTISAPGYMSLLTATWANKHNVRGNSKLSPNYDYWNIFRIVESVDSSRHTALFSTWLDNRTVLLGEGRPDAGNFRLDHAADGFERDTVAFPHDPASKYILAIDERVSRDAAAYIAAKGPDLSWIYLQHTDDAAHANGDGEGFDAAVRQADAQVGRIWDAVKQRQAMGEEWMIVVTTDHGRDAPTGKGHGGQSVRERTTWIVTNQSALGPRFRNGTLAIVDIAPSILQHLGITAPAAVAGQMEGVSFLQPRAR